MKAIAKYLTATALLLAGFVGLAMSLCSGATALGMLVEAARGISKASLGMVAILLFFLALGGGILWKSYQALQKLFREDK